MTRRSRKIEFLPRQPYDPDATADRDGVRHLAFAMDSKLAAKRAEGYGGWNKPDQCTVEHLAKLLLDHLPKGDPVDVANFCMMLFNRDGGAEALAKAAQSRATVERAQEPRDETPSPLDWVLVPREPSAEMKLRGSRLLNMTSHHVWDAMVSAAPAATPSPPPSPIDPKSGDGVEALKTAQAWLDRWAVHVGSCRGSTDLCTCGLQRVRYEVNTALIG